MRLNAYKDAVMECLSIKNSIPNMRDYFQDNYSPKRQAIKYILNKAKKDKRLFKEEFMELKKTAMVLLK